MFTPGSKRAILRDRILACPGETFTKSEVCQLSDAGPSTAKFVLNQMTDAGEVELLTDTFPSGWRVAGTRSSKQVKLRSWLLRYPGETFTGRRVFEQYGGDIAYQTALKTLNNMVERGEAVKLGNTSTARWIVADKQRKDKSTETLLLEVAGLPPLDEWVSNL